MVHCLLVLQVPIWDIEGTLIDRTGLWTLQSDG